MRLGRRFGAIVRSILEDEVSIFESVFNPLQYVRCFSCSYQQSTKWLANEALFLYDPASSLGTIHAERKYFLVGVSSSRMLHTHHSSTV